MGPFKVLRTSEDPTRHCMNALYSSSNNLVNPLIQVFCDKYTKYSPKLSCAPQYIDGSGEVRAANYIKKNFLPTPKEMIGLKILLKGKRKVLDSHLEALSFLIHRIGCELEDVLKGKNERLRSDFFFQFSVKELEKMMGIGRDTLRFIFLQLSNFGIAETKLESFCTETGKSNPKFHIRLNPYIYKLCPWFRKLMAAFKNKNFREFLEMSSTGFLNSKFYNRKSAFQHCKDILAYIDALVRDCIKENYVRDVRNQAICQAREPKLTDRGPPRDIMLHLYGRREESLVVREGGSMSEGIDFEKFFDWCMGICKEKGIDPFFIDRPECVRLIRTHKLHKKELIHICRLLVQAIVEGKVDLYLEDILNASVVGAYRERGERVLAFLKSQKSNYNLEKIVRAIEDRESWGACAGIFTDRDYALINEADGRHYLLTLDRDERMLALKAALRRMHQNKKVTREVVDGAYYPQQNFAIALQREKARKHSCIEIKYRAAPGREKKEVEYDDLGLAIPKDAEDKHYQFLRSEILRLRRAKC